MMKSNKRHHHLSLLFTYHHGKGLNTVFPISLNIAEILRGLQCCGPYEHEDGEGQEVVVGYHAEEICSKKSFRKSLNDYVCWEDPLEIEGFNCEDAR